MALRPRPPRGGHRPVAHGIWRQPQPSPHGIRVADEQGDDPAALCGDRVYESGSLRPYHAAARRDRARGQTGGPEPLPLSGAVGSVDILAPLVPAEPGSGRPHPAAFPLSAALQQAPEPGGSPATAARARDTAAGPPRSPDRLAQPAQPDGAAEGAGTERQPGLPAVLRSQRLQAHQ